LLGSIVLAILLMLHHLNTYTRSVALAVLH